MKTQQSERIELVSDTEAVIKHLDGSNCMRIKVVDDCVELSHECSLLANCQFKVKKLDGLIDVLNCFRDTGSFAALRDDSAVQFVGKVVKATGSGL